jgi:translation initiation factor 3 subunit L
MCTDNQNPIEYHVYLCTGDPNSVAGEFGRHSLYKMLGYFSLVGLLRLHSLLGDYYQALKVLENVDFNKKVWFNCLIFSTIWN